MRCVLTLIALTLVSPLGSGALSSSNAVLHACYTAAAAAGRSCWAVLGAYCVCMCEYWIYQRVLTQVALLILLLLTLPIQIQGSASTAQTRSIVRGFTSSPTAELAQELTAAAYPCKTLPCLFQQPNTAAAWLLLLLLCWCRQSLVAPVGIQNAMGQHKAPGMLLLLPCCAPACYVSYGFECWMLVIEKLNATHATSRRAAATKLSCCPSRALESVADLAGPTRCQAAMHAR